MWAARITTSRRCPGRSSGSAGAGRSLHLHVGCLGAVIFSGRREKWICGIIVDTIAASPYVTCGRNFSYLHPPTIDEISKPIHLSDPKGFELEVSIDAFLVASGRSITTTSSLLSPLPELFVLWALRAASLSRLSHSSRRSNRPGRCLLIK